MNLDVNIQNSLVKQGPSSSSKTAALKKFQQESQSTSSDNELFSRAPKPQSHSDLLVWDIENSSPLMVVFNHGCSVRRRKCKDSTDLVRTRQPLAAGTHIIQCTFNEKPWGSHCAIGLVMKGAQSRLEGYGHLMGQDEKSWCLDIPSRKVMHNGSIRPGYTMPGYDEEIGRQISMVINTKKGTLAFVVNGKSLGIAYTNLRRGELFPAISMVYGRQEVHLAHNFIPCDDVDSSGEEASDSDSSLTAEETMEGENPDDFVTLVEISELPLEQQAVLQVAHGWNEKRMGEKLCGVMPNAPNICYPPKPTFSVSFPYRQQAIVARRGFAKGRYVWQITEEVINHFLMRGGPENMPLKQNDVIIGVSTDDFDSLMDAGIPLRWDYSRKFWGWKVSDSCLVFRRRRRSHRYPLHPARIDLKRGVQVILDCDSHTLSFAFAGQDLGVAFRSLPAGRELFPTIIFDGHSWFPIRLEMLMAPQQYLEDFISEAETSSLDKEEYLELIGFQTLPDVDRKDDQVEANRVVRTKFGWYTEGQPAYVCKEQGHSESVFHTIFIDNSLRENPEAPTDNVIFSEFGLMYTGRHVIYINLPNIHPKEHYRIGFVDSTYVELWEELHMERETPLEDQQREATERVMLNHYWAWDLLEHKLCHAGRHICNYPVVGFNAFKFKHYQLVVDIRKVITVSLFAADSQTGDDLDLGVMVTNLTDRRPIYPMLHFVDGKSLCRLLYMEGPKAFVEEFERVQSRSCSIL